MAFGQLPCHPQRAIAQQLQHVFEQVHQTMRGLKQHQGARFAGQVAEPGTPLTRAGRQDAFKAEAAGRQTAAHQRRGHGAGPRHADHLMARSPDRCHQLFAGIGDPGQPRITNHRQGLACRQLGQQLGDATVLVVLMKADQPR